jgi:hypothetical protein
MSLGELVLFLLGRLPVHRLVGVGLVPFPNVLFELGLFNIVPRLDIVLETKDS